MKTYIKIGMLSAALVWSVSAYAEGDVAMPRAT